MKESPVVKHIHRALTPFAQFAKDQVTASILLLLATSAALIWANSDYADTYHHIFSTAFGIHFGNHNLNLSLETWTSEGLMALFFFFLGLEIKRELLVGELREFQQALPVIMAAIGGMLFPALFYLMTNSGSPQTLAGWGIPMATDTAFAIGILALLRNHVPLGIALFVTALAILDDIGAMLIIAIFYTDSIALQPLLIAFAVTASLLLLNRLGVRQPWAYILGGVWMWLEFHASGVHATIAGVLVAFTVPARPDISRSYFLKNISRLAKRFESLKAKRRNQGVLGDREQHELVNDVKDYAERASTPLRRWEALFEKPITLLVMPLFALANAGITFSGDFFNSLIVSQSAVGIFAGLAIGKPLGVVLMTWLAIHLNWGRLPTNVSMKHVIGIGLLAGIGFTMSILISNLAFAGSPDVLAIAKSAVLIASLCAGVMAYCWLRFATKPDNTGNFH